MLGHTNLHDPCRSTGPLSPPYARYIRDMGAPHERVIMSEEMLYEEDDSSFGLSSDQAKSQIGPKNEWLKFTKGQVIRAALVYFHTVDRVAVSRHREKNPADRKNNEVLTRVGKEALAAHMKKLGKTTLAPWERLDITEAQFLGFRYHYVKEMGYFNSRLGKDGPDADAVWKKIEEPKQGYSTLLLIYPTDSKGDVKLATEQDKMHLATNWSLKPWRFGKGTFEELLKQHQGLLENGISIAAQDLKIECQDTQYQRTKVTFVGKCLWQQIPSFRQAVLEAAMPMYDDLKPFRDMTTDQLREKLGLTAPMGNPFEGVQDFGGALSMV